MGKVVLALLASLVGYLLLWPVDITPQLWQPPQPPAAEGIYAPNTALNAAERRFAEIGHGGEAVAIDPQGLLYTGLLDGRLMRLDPATGLSQELVNTGGRPLGLKFAPDGRLLIADALKGLLAWDGSQVQVLADQFQGAPLRFADDLAISKAGLVYFSDASTRFGIDEVMAEAFEHAPNGRVLAYDLNTGQLREVLGGLYFANGVALSAEEDFLLVNETTRYRIRRLWLQGPQAGKDEVLIENLPGFPDNITLSPRGSYWVALYGPRSPMLDELLPRPFLRTMAWRLPAALQPHPPRIARVLELDAQGKVLRSLEGHGPDVYAPSPSALEWEGLLWLGSRSDAGLGYWPLPDVAP